MESIILHSEHVKPEFIWQLLIHLYHLLHKTHKMFKANILMYTFINIKTCKFYISFSKQYNFVIQTLGPNCFKHI